MRAPLRLVVLGNCQAESLRLLLAGPDVESVRLPAVHELTGEDLGELHRLLATADALVAQPVAADHRRLPIGTDQLRERLRPGAQVVLVPPVRFAGLYPFHVLVHPPHLSDTEPPVAPYHDLRTVVAAAWLARGQQPSAVPALTTAMVRAIADDSLVELRTRERAHGTLVVSDLLDDRVQPVGFEAMRTVNHPGNRVLAPLVARIRTALDLTSRPPALTRPLLDRIHAPRLSAVAEVLDPGAGPRAHWLIDGAAVDADAVAAVQLGWYADRPALVAEALRRSVRTLAHLGLEAPEPATVAAPR